MKAIVFTEYGSPDRLQLKEVPVPVPAADQVLVKVYASSVNSWDWEYLNGKPFINRLFFGLLKPKRQILGADIAGVVEAVGEDVTRLRPGDHVLTDLSDNWGGFAEYACANELAVKRKPENATFEQAAAVPQAGVLALQGIRKVAPLTAGQKVLINGAGGGVGTFAVQLAKLAGAEVTGVDAVHKLDVVRKIGADRVMDFAQFDFTATGERYDLIVDCQNFRSMSDNRRALRPGGTYAMIGGSMARALQLWLMSLIAPFIGERRKLCLVAEGPNAGLQELTKLIEAGKLVAVIDKIYDLSEVPDALYYFGQGRHKGKIAVKIASSVKVD